MIKKRKGFSLIEIIIVMVIIGILGSIVAPKIFGNPNKAKKLKVQSELAGLSLALKMYESDHGKYPSQGQGLLELTKKPGKDIVGAEYGYIEQSHLIDPWGNAYIYTLPGSDWYFDIYTLGADGVEGGDGIDATIKSKR